MITLTLKRKFSKRELAEHICQYVDAEENGVSIKKLASLITNKQVRFFATTYMDAMGEYGEMSEAMGEAMCHVFGVVAEEVRLKHFAEIE